MSDTVSATARATKSRIEEVLEQLVRAPWRIAATSESALFRKINLEQPTLLMDELDTTFGRTAEANEALRAILNAGNRPGAAVARVVGEGASTTVVDFSVYCPKVLAGIQTAPDTVLDRAIVVELRRKKQSETVERLRVRKLAAELEPLRAELARWASEHVEELREREPEFLPDLDDRAFEAWEPLLAIAELAELEGAPARCLTDHLLPTFRAYPLDKIDAEAIDAFTARKRRKGLSATSCNRLVQVLAAVLEDAVEYDLIARNPAAGKRRRLQASEPRRTYLDRADHIGALLDAAGELDRLGRGEPYRRALIATLALGGLRIGECLDLRWRDVELANGRLVVCRSKTAPGERRVDLLPVMRDELATLAATRKGEDLDAYVFATSTGRRRTASNARRRVFAAAVDRANARLAERSIEPLPERLTPHSLRRTFASLLYALGETPPRVMAQMGHTSPQLALAIYAREMDRRDGEPERLRALVSGEFRALTGTEPRRDGD